ncbi:2229_t:CDS:2 [Paraglomus brasilianum]|uniref:2229_t:CDS:1 n=1 Tax=Paraglomus brasilianum TaxID=144538 RepID=A0A9N9FS41_9GLOM|nr:2229_t:CDS:2 [Paraglomus brasilianum]
MTVIGVVDIGSNGIRFSIVASLARCLPVIFEERAGISLFEAQHQSKSANSNPIPDSVIRDTVNSLKRFKYVCKHYKVDIVRVIATEAMRMASNSAELGQRVKEATGWEIEILHQQEEAKISAMGVISSFFGVKGLVMDMGGGSVEFNYVYHDLQNQSLTMSDDPQCLPYGSAALTKLLGSCTNREGRSRLYKALVGELKVAFNNLGIPENITRAENKNGGFVAYVSGGGFRALGYVSMSARAPSSVSERRMYPIPIINGYGTKMSNLLDDVNEYLPSFDSGSSPKSTERNDNDSNPYRISKRRAKLLPACSFLMNALSEAISIKYIYFCEGGVKQGICFSMMNDEERQKDPFFTFIKSNSLSDNFTQNQQRIVLSTLKSSIPSTLYEILDLSNGLSLGEHRLERLLPSIVYLSKRHDHLAKEARPFAAFNLALAGGALSNAPGITHSDRAIIAWCLMHRYHDDVGGGSGGIEERVKEMDPVLFDSIRRMVPGKKRGRKICELIGRLTGLYLKILPGDPLDSREGASTNALNSIPGLKVRFTESSGDGSDRLRATKIISRIFEPKNNQSMNVRIELVIESDANDSNFLFDNVIVKEALRKLEKDYTLKDKKNVKKQKKGKNNHGKIRIEVVVKESEVN